MNLTFPGRLRHLRPMSTKELKATTVLSMPISEASAKVSEGGPTDVAEDTRWPVWAGVLPLCLTPGAPVPAEDMPAGIAVPDYVRSYKIG